MRLLIVDDEQTICWGLARLATGLGHEAVTAASAEEGLQAAQQKTPDVIILDVRLPGMDGLTAMQHFRRLAPAAPIVVITAYGDLATAVAAVRNGAFEYLIKPFDLEVAQRVIQRATALATGAVKEPVAKPTPMPQTAGIVGQSLAMQEVFKRIALVAPAEACVHLVGESGAGKELVARAIHQFSRRSGGPFVPVNIAALNPTIVESELFGHVRGAFTGADQQHAGLLEQSHGGTIFLDEVADIPLSLQVKLLRAVEHGEVLPVGAGRPIQIDLRIVSATHQNLTQLVTAGRFRQDLYFRLATFQIELPPLRERPGDIRPLAEHFVALLSQKNRLATAGLPPETVAVLETRPWHGNVRELKNAIEHALIMARGGPILPDHLPPPVPPGAETAATTGQAGLVLDTAGAGSGEKEIADLIRRWADARLRDSADAEDLHRQLLNLVEPPLFSAALDKHHGQRLAAARSLGLHRMTLRKKLAEFGMDAPPEA